VAASDNGSSLNSPYTYIIYQIKTVNKTNYQADSGKGTSDQTANDFALIINTVIALA
jgi:hypothetical protein